MSNLNKDDHNTNTSWMETVALVNSTCFEDLSNELIYEVFDYFDSWNIYEIFSKLNIRFQQLFVGRNFRLKITLPFTSRTDFLRRCEELVKPNIDRISSLSIENCCAIDLFFKSFSIHSFIHLETLILDDVTSTELLIKLLHSAVALPRLFTLCITSSIYYQNENVILQNIFHLPVINYCKLSLDGNFKRTSLPCAIDKQHQCQSLKYLIISNDFRLDHLVPILSYTPQLTHLSCRVRSGFDHPISDVPVPPNLVDVTLTFHDISFNDMEKFLSKISGKLQRLRVTTHMNHEFVCADRWEQLILNYMPHLQRFDFSYDIIEYSIPSHDYIISESLFDRFKSTFWSDRQWFFKYHSWSCENDDLSGIFYSTDPFRRKHYELYRCENYETTITSATHLTVGIDSIPTDCSIHFPNVTKLSLIQNDRQSKDRSIININRIVPLIQITHVIIQDPHFTFDQLIKLLSASSNIQSLTFIGVSFINEYYPSTEQLNLIRQISKTSKVIKLLIADECSLEYITLFTNLCPHLQRLEIVPSELQFKPIIRFLLSSNISNLFWLCVQSITQAIERQIQTMIRREQLLVDYSIKDHYIGLYIWW